MTWRSYKQAEEWFKRILSINPNHLRARLGKMGIYPLWEAKAKEAYALMETLPQYLFLC